MCVGHCTCMFVQQRDRVRLRERIQWPAFKAVSQHSVLSGSSDSNCYTLVGRVETTVSSSTVCSNTTSSYDMFILANIKKKNYNSVYAYHN